MNKIKITPIDLQEGTILTTAAKQLLPDELSIVISNDWDLTSSTSPQDILLAQQTIHTKHGPLTINAVLHHPAKEGEPYMLEGYIFDQTKITSTHRYAQLITEDNKPIALSPMQQLITKLQESEQEKDTLSSYRRKTPTRLPKDWFYTIIDSQKEDKRSNNLIEQYGFELNETAPDATSYINLKELAKVEDSKQASRLLKDLYKSMEFVLVNNLEQKQIWVVSNSIPNIFSFMVKEHILYIKLKKDGFYIRFCELLDHQQPDIFTNIMSYLDHRTK